MVTPFPQTAFSIRKSCIHLGARVFSGLLAVSSLCVTADDATQAVELKTYTAQYVTKAKGISVTLDRKLARKADGSYELTNGGSKLIAGFKEISKFRIKDSRVVPASYVYQGTGLMNRRREVQFTAGSDTIRSLYKDQWYELPYTANTYDRMSQQEQMRLHLMQDDTPKESVTITVADGKRIKDHQLDYVGEETLDTPMGPLKTLRFARVHDDPERKSDTWLAPELDYLMVKTVHVDDGSKVVATLVAATIDGLAGKGE